MPYVELPEKKSDLAETLKRVVAMGESERNIRRVEWLVNRFYMNGVRNFLSLNYRDGTVRGRYEGTKGEIDYKFEALVRKFQTEQGRLLRLDTTPAIDREGVFSLDGLRNASMAQAALNVQYREARMKHKRGPFTQCLLMYGTAGLACWGQSSGRMGRPQTVVEVVPPWELLPVPASPSLRSKVEAVVRLRFLPVEWLKTKQGLDLAGAKKKGMETVSVPYGRSPEAQMFGDASGADGTVIGASGTKDAGSYSSKEGMTGKEYEVEYVKTAEVFIPEEDGSLDRYIVWCGGFVALDEKYRGQAEPPMMPMGVARYIDVGDFYGRSFVSILLPTNREVEYLLKRLFENAQDLDQFGYLMMPLNMGIDFNQFKSTARPRIVGYDPDLTTPEHKPFNISPTNTGDWPGKVANMGRDLLQDLAGQSEMLAGGAPGRVDSASGLGLLQETASIPLVPTAESIAGAYSVVYKAMVGMARETWPAENLAYLTSLDDSLIGVVLDASTGQIQLDQNSVPAPLSVETTIRAALPRSVHQRKMELLTMLQQQAVTMREFRRISRVEGLDFPLGSKAEFENYRKAVLHNILLFGDGKKPGQINMSSEADNPEIHLEVLGDFMARPEYMLASKEVQMAFLQRKLLYQNMLGKQYPQDLEYPEDAAMMAGAGPAQPAEGAPQGASQAGGESEPMF